MKSLKTWKENFVSSQRRAEAHERRALAAERELRRREAEMLEWSRSLAASRESVLTGTY